MCGDLDDSLLIESTHVFAHPDSTRRCRHAVVALMGDSSASATAGCRARTNDGVEFGRDSFEQALLELGGRQLAQHRALAVEE